MVGFMQWEKERDLAGEGPDFRHIETWIFDLDNTLYRAESNLFTQIEERMTRFIVERLGLPVEEARRLRQAYYRDYGSTLSGLIVLNGIDPEAFLAYVHDVDLSAIAPDPSLNEAFARLQGRRFVFTNGCRRHARRVLDRLGLTEAMDDIWDIRTLAYTPKPQAEAYRRIVVAGAFAPESAAMFDDMACNLMPADALGMTTVWINNGASWSHQGLEFPPVARRHIHHEIDDLAEFLHAIRV